MYKGASESLQRGSRLDLAELAGVEPEDQTPELALASARRAMVQIDEHLRVVRGAAARRELGQKKMALQNQVVALKEQLGLTRKHERNAVLEAFCEVVCERIPRGQFQAMMAAAYRKVAQDEEALAVKIVAQTEAE